MPFSGRIDSLRRHLDELLASLVRLPDWTNTGARSDCGIACTESRWRTGKEEGAFSVRLSSLPYLAYVHASNIRKKENANLSGLDLFTRDMLSLHPIGNEVQNGRQD